MVAYLRFQSSDLLLQDRRAAPTHHLLHEAGCAANAAADEIAVAADIFGEQCTVVP
jgi:hypothetical protein